MKIVAVINSPIFEEEPGKFIVRTNCHKNTEKHFFSDIHKQKNKYVYNNNGNNENSNNDALDELMIQQNNVDLTPKHKYHEHTNLSLKEKDDRFLKIQQLIDIKKKMLLQNQHKLKKITNQNDFLEKIKNDYTKYNAYIVQQKKDQMNALQMLNDYIKDLSSSGELSEQNIKDSKEEQTKILRELKTIQNSLHEIVNKDENDQIVDKDKNKQIINKNENKQIINKNIKNK